MRQQRNGVAVVNCSWACLSDVPFQQMKCALSPSNCVLRETSPAMSRGIALAACNRQESSEFCLVQVWRGPTPTLSPRGEPDKIRCGIARSYSAAALRSGGLPKVKGAREIIAGGANVLLVAGQPCTLSSVEAMAAALYICGLEEDARTVMARFHWRAGSGTQMSNFCFVSLMRFSPPGGLAADARRAASP